MSLFGSPIFVGPGAGTVCVRLPVKPVYPCTSIPAFTMRSSRTAARKQFSSASQMAASRVSMRSTRGIIPEIPKSYSVSAPSSMLPARAKQGARWVLQCAATPATTLP